jgi:hypothetical protein
MRHPSARLQVSVVLALVLVIWGGKAALPAGTPADLPARLTGPDLWRLSTEFSEPDGTFRSENLISNEMVLARLLPEVAARVAPNGVYLGVGPEQNFSYIAALRPKMAFITDVRRGNLHVLLMYKALFELSSDRAEFVSRLFTKARPAALSATASARQIMDAYWEAPSGDEVAYQANLADVIRHLTITQAIPLPPDDREGIAGAYRTFHYYGPAINYMASTTLTSVIGGRGGNSATYWDLMTQAAADGQELSFLSSEETFGFVKSFHSRNLLVPVVGDFGGPKAIRAIGEYVRSHGTTVSAFYVSTVEPYLRRAGTLGAFCENVGTLPVTADSVFIRPGNAGQFIQLTAPATRAAITPATIGGAGGLGQYQIGIVAPIQGGCG